MNEEAQEIYWSRFADTYDQQQAYVAGKSFLEEINAELKLLFDLGNGVELGCGTGKFSEAIAQNADSLVATDLSDALLEKARQRFSDHHQIKLQIQNCMATSFRAGQFDTVFMANLLHVIESPRQVIQESHRILKPDGKLIIVTYTSYGMKILDKIKLVARFLRSWGKPPRHTHNFSPQDLSSLIQNAGFTVTTSKLLMNKTRSLYVIAKKL